MDCYMAQTFSWIPKNKNEQRAFELKIYTLNSEDAKKSEKWPISETCSGKSQIQIFFSLLLLS